MYLPSGAVELSNVLICPLCFGTVPPTPALFMNPSITWPVSQCVPSQCVTHTSPWSKNIGADSCCFWYIGFFSTWLSLYRMYTCPFLWAAHISIEWHTLAHTHARTYTHTHISTSVCTWCPWPFFVVCVCVHVRMHVCVCFGALLCDVHLVTLCHVQA